MNRSTIQWKCSRNGLKVRSTTDLDKTALMEAPEVQKHSPDDNFMWRRITIELNSRGLTPIGLHNIEQSDQTHAAKKHWIGVPVVWRLQCRRLQGHAAEIGFGIQNSYIFSFRQHRASEVGRSCISKTESSNLSPVLIHIFVHHFSIIEKRLFSISIICTFGILHYVTLVQI